jgi:hypothetical protein
VSAATFVYLGLGLISALIQVSMRTLRWMYSTKEIYSLLRMIFRRAALLATDPGASAIPVLDDPSTPGKLGYSVCDWGDIIEDPCDKKD